MSLGALPEPMYHGGPKGSGHAHTEPAAPAGPTLDLVLELNGEWHGHQVEAGVKDPNSGGNVIYLSPGCASAQGNWSAFASVGLPIVNHLYGVQAEPDWRLLTGVAVTSEEPMPKIIICLLLAVAFAPPQLWRTPTRPRGWRCCIRGRPPPTRAEARPGVHEDQDLSGAPERLVGASTVAATKTELQEPAGDAGKPTAAVVIEPGKEAQLTSMVRTSC